jgi:hypothetical protein
MVDAEEQSRRHQKSCKCAHKGIVAVARASRKRSASQRALGNNALFFELLANRSARLHETAEFPFPV